jgi:hypothetical protein
VPDSDPVMTDQDGSIAIDVPCVSCGYNLRGLTRDGNCPECSTPIESSVHGDLLRMSDPAWVERLHRGATWMFFGPMVGFGGAMITVELLAGPIVDLVPALGPSAYGPVVGLGLVGSGLVVPFLAGVRMATTPDPRGTPNRWQAVVRSIARSGWLVPAAVFSIGIAASVWSADAGFRLAMLGALLVACWLAAVFRHIGVLAGRIPSRSIQRWSRYGSWACASVLLTIPPIIVAGTSGSRAALANYLMFTLVIPADASVILFLIVLSLCRREFASAASQARRNAPPPD